MDEQKLQKVKAIFQNYREVKLAYLFGSAVSGTIGPLSDFDFGLYRDPYDRKSALQMNLDIRRELSSILATDAVDLVMLNGLQNTVLKYEIISQGELIHDIEPYRVIVEPAILAEYFDYKQSMRKYGLTRS